MASLVSNIQRSIWAAGTWFLIKKGSVAFRGWSRSLSGVSFGWGAVGGLYAVSFCHQAAARFGDASIAFAAASAAVALGVLIGGVWARRSPRSSIVPLLIPAIWTLVFGLLADTAVRRCGYFELSALASLRGQFTFLFATAFLLLGLPAICAARLALAPSALRGGWLLCGAACAIALAVAMIGPWFGIQWAGWIGAICSVTVVVRRIRKQAAAPAASPVAASGRPATFWSIPAIAGSAVVGILATALGRLLFQLYPATEAEQWIAAAGFLGGAAAGCGFAARRLHDPRRAAVVFALSLAAFGSALPLLCFRGLVDLSLAATANFSQVVLLMFVRGIAASAILFPAGAAWGALLSFARRSSPSQRSPGLSRTEAATEPLLPLSPLVPALLLGAAGCRWLLLSGWSLSALVGGSAASMAVLAAALALGVSADRQARFRIAVALAMVATLGSVALSRQFGTYDPERAARLLFSTNVFMARRAGFEPRLLPFLDDRRLVAIHEGDRGTYTVWKQHGVQLHIRESGIPRGAVSTQPEVCPQFSSEVMPAALPLVLHEEPRRVLVLGLGSGEGLATCLEFPLAEVACLEGDRALIDVLRSAVWSDASANPLTDERVRLVEIEPAWGVRARGGSYDVVLSQTDQAGVANGTPYFTREFYAGAASQLASDGIFAQRFQQIDFGPWPLRSVLATLQSVFKSAAAVEAGAGEIVLLATNSEKGFGRPGLLSRFQHPQVSRSFAQLGWDWSITLNLASYSGKGCAALLANSPAINTAANGLFAYRLPQETMRWGSKLSEMGSALAPHAGRVGEWPNVDGSDAVLCRRLADVVRQRKLMTEYPDQRWAYRKEVREGLQKHPHTEIKEGDQGLDRRLDAVDQRRVNYFRELGRAAQTATLTPEILQRVEEFAEPYDPAITYFLHDELAVLYARAGGSDPRPELRHRLYEVYYSDTRDRSVRDVVAAIRKVAESGTVIGPAQQWDHLNALLEFLKTRWSNRGFGTPSSPRISLNDLDQSISAAETAVAEMGKLRPQLAISQADWDVRREGLEQLLIRPLCTYRTQLVPYYLKDMHPTAATPAPVAGDARRSAN